MNDLVAYMNYGYAPLEGEHVFLKDHCHQPWVYAMQMYHFAVVRFAGIEDLKDKTILELGCGRGRGLLHLVLHLKPKRAIGIDLAAGSTAFCTDRYKEF
mmetsp:Transcript_33078/g.24347  ORF Transcript_33078/g.24347 Transcript_33078/m.24347 type:complete len:99 (+) Transcript_33078:268-564(+)